MKWKKRDYVVSPTLADNHYFGKKAYTAASRSRKGGNRRKSSAFIAASPQPSGASRVAVLLP